jgi:serine/threonine protein kinase
MLGQTLGDRYKIQQQLSKKAGRQTFLAKDQQTQALVVIKVLTFDREFEWDDLKLFEREAQTLRHLSHESIPRYLDYFEVELPSHKGFALVQTYIAAKSLEEYLKEGRTFSEVEVKQLAKSLLEILIYLHQQNPPVIHRDIKPSNILLANRSGHSIGQVYLVDFGSVQTIAAREGSTMTVVGTYGFMPPEQFGGRVTPASDIYSLGATIIYLVTGISPADLPQKDLQIQFETYTNLSPTLTNWLKRAIAPSLEKRFQSAKEALEALETPQLVPVIASAIEQPFGSRILLTKNDDIFQLVFPPKGFNAGVISKIVFAIAWNSFIIFWTTMALNIPNPINIFFALFSLPFWAVGISMVVGILFTLFGRVKLRINREKISLDNKLFGFKYPHSPSAPREKINKIQRTNFSIVRSNDERIKIPLALVIWAGNRKYNLNFDLSEPELDWLAYELSNWLGLAIEEKQ